MTRSTTHAQGGLARALLVSPGFRTLDTTFKPRRGYAKEAVVKRIRRTAPLSAPLVALFALLSVGLAPTDAAAQQPAQADELLHKGDYYFKAGYYFKASESYRLALLEDPTSPWKKLAFGNALFAIGNYSYASYALRRGVAELDPAEPFRPDVAGLFPSRRKFTQAVRDLKRYVTYSPRDPAGLTVLGYVLFSIDGEEQRCRAMLEYLKRLDPDDPFADFFLAQLRRRTRNQVQGEAVPEAEAMPPLEDEPVVEMPAPPPPRDDVPPPPPPEETPIQEVVPPPQRQAEELEQEWPEPTAAPAR